MAAIVALSSAGTGFVYRLCSLAYQRSQLAHRKRADELEAGAEFRDELRNDLRRAMERIASLEQAELASHRRERELEYERDGYRNQVLALERIGQAQLLQIEESQMKVAHLEIEVASLRVELRRVAALRADGDGPPDAF